MLIKCRLIKKWGEYTIGDETMFDERKARPLIAKGILMEVKSSKPERTRPRAETATAEPAAETAEVTPSIENKKTEAADSSPQVKQKKDDKKGREAGEK